MRNKDKKYNFTSFELAIRESRMKKILTREQVGNVIFIAPRYLTNIENKSQHPSLQVFYDLVTLFNISADKYFYPDNTFAKSTRRRQIETQMDNN